MTYEVEFMLTPNDNEVEVYFLGGEVEPFIIILPSPYDPNGLDTTIQEISEVVHNGSLINEPADMEIIEKVGGLTGATTLGADVWFHEETNREWK